MNKLMLLVATVVIHLPVHGQTGNEIKCSHLLSRMLAGSINTALEFPIVLGMNHKFKKSEVDKLLRADDLATSFQLSNPGNSLAKQEIFMNLSADKIRELLGGKKENIGPYVTYVREQRIHRALK